MTLILIILLVLLFAGGGWGYSTGYMTYQHPLNIVLLVVLLLLLLGLVGGPRLGWWGYW